MSEKTNATVPLRNFRIRRERPQTYTLLPQIPTADDFYDAEVFGLFSVSYIFFVVQEKGGRGSRKQTR
jgi:hypothetical protein